MVGHGTSLLPLLLVVGQASNSDLFSAPASFDLSAVEVWREDLVAWRSRTLKEINFTGRIYEDSRLAWTRTSYIQPQVHTYDLALYNGTHYTVDSYLDGLEELYGGIDAVLLWPTYTNIGVDDRNQFDYFRALPGGGLAAVRDITKQFHARDVKVLWAYNPWDESTRPEGVSDAEAMASLLSKTGGDGFNGDTMGSVGQEYYAASVALGHPLALEPEGGGYDDLNASNWETMGWGYWWSQTAANNFTNVYDFAPGVDKLKWLDSRRMTNVCDRWSKNRTAAIQFAFFNGVGYESWENVWGLFNAFNERDAELLRRASALLRYFGKHEYIQEYADWEPHSPSGNHAVGQGVFNSRFRHVNGDSLWFLVNRLSSPSKTAPIAVTAREAATLLFYDAYTGKELYPQEGALGSRGAAFHLAVSVEDNGIGAVLATTRANAAAVQLDSFLNRMADMTSDAPLSSFTWDWAYLPQTMVSSDGARSGDAWRMHSGARQTVRVPETNFHFRSSGVELEGGCDHAISGADGVCCGDDDYFQDPPRQCGIAAADINGVDVQFPWEDHPSRTHDKVMTLGPFEFDKFPVTKAEYAEFLNATGYQGGDDDYNWLKDWPRRCDDDSVTGQPCLAPGDEMQPVTYVSLQEARDFCAWDGGKRLPMAYEWQLAAQGGDGRQYPWGNESNPANMPSPVTDSRTLTGAALVNSHSPAGDSPFGAADLVGNVWQFTGSEFFDAHTRSVVLKGSSYWQPTTGSDYPTYPQYLNWYFPKALELSKHNKYFLMDASYERAGTIGFRCLADVDGGQRAPYYFSD